MWYILVNSRSSLIKAYAHKIDQTWLYRLFLSILILLITNTQQNVLYAESTRQVQIYGFCINARKNSFNRLINETYDRSYLLVRKRIIMAGWQPAPLRETSRWRQPPESPASPVGEEKIFLEKGYTELDSCAVDRDAPCVFLFQDKHGDALRVYTNGEEYPPSHAKVGFMMLACPPGHLP